jgi:SpoVK/Ycf46/Vps4 family AAA+-type ATPase
MSLDIIWASIYMILVQKLLDPKFLTELSQKFFNFWNRKMDSEEEFVRIDSSYVKVKNFYSQYPRSNKNEKIISYVCKFLEFNRVSFRKNSLNTFNSTDCSYEPRNEIYFRDFRFELEYTENDDKSFVSKVLTIYGDTAEIKKFIEECRVFNEKEKTRLKRKIPVYSVIPAYDKFYFSRAVFRSLQKFENLFLPSKENFIESLEKYKKGQLSKVSFLLHGVPGCGKTSFIKSVVNYLGLPVMDLKLNDINNAENLRQVFFGDTLCTIKYDQDNFKKIGDRIIILEDVDADGETTHTRKKSAPVKKEEAEEAFWEKYYNKRPTLSTLLNVLDGVVEFHGIIIMTTNHVEKLDPALIRPGRITHNIELKKISAESAAEMTAYYYGAPIAVPAGKYTPAELDTLCKISTAEQFKRTVQI